MTAGSCGERTRARKTSGWAGLLAAWCWRTWSSSRRRFFGRGVLVARGLPRSARDGNQKAATMARMRRARVFLLLIAALAWAQQAAAPVAVAIDREPVHHLFLENETVRVFKVEVPAGGRTMLHQH